MLVGGYKTLTPIQIANLLHGLSSKLIAWPSARVFFACAEMLAIREAVARTTRRRVRGKKVAVAPAFDAAEMGKITGLSRRAVGRAISQISQVGLIRLSSTDLQLSAEPIEGVGDTLEALAGGRTLKRPIPVPRRVLRFLARQQQPALGKVMLGYICRGMTLGRRNATVKSSGTVKASWLAETTGLSIRSVRYARARLQRSSWIEKDTGSKQWKLNRHGSWFRVNLSWNPVAEQSTNASYRPILASHRFAPRISTIRTPVAPLKEDRETLSESKNRETLSGHFEKKGRTAFGPSSESVRKPDLGNIQLCDLREHLRLSGLFEQAVRAGWVRRCDSDRINFSAAAIRALTTPSRDPVRVFVSLIRKRLWNHITHAQEDLARKHHQTTRSNAQKETRTAGNLQSIGGIISGVIGSFQLLNRRTSHEHEVLKTEPLRASIHHPERCLTNAVDV